MTKSLHFILPNMLNMNIDNNHRFDPAAELHEARRPYKHWCITPLLFIAGILLIFLWAYYTNGCISADGSSGGQGSGLTDAGGTGSANSGNKSGSGNKNSGSGSQQAPSQQGSGSTADSPGSKQDSSGKTESNVSGQEDKSQELIELPPEQKHKKMVFATEQTPPQKTAQKADNGGAVEGRKGFYGVKGKPGGKVIFLIDISGSMLSNSQEYAGKSRIEVLKLELKKEIFAGTAPNAQTYRRSGGCIIMAFSGNTTRYPEKKLYRYRKKNDMQEVDGIIDKLNAGGGTNMRQAWDKALDAVKNEKIPTVYFLTDGQPSDSFDAKWLREQIKRNRIRRLTIHCISIGEQRDFMKQIAQEYNGQYIFIP